MCVHRKLVDVGAEVELLAEHHPKELQLAADRKRGAKELDRREVWRGRLPGHGHQLRLRGLKGNPQSTSPGFQLVYGCLKYSCGGLCGLSRHDRRV